jgi:hypothetical protein
MKGDGLPIVTRPQDIFAKPLSTFPLLGQDMESSDLTHSSSTHQKDPTASELPEAARMALDSDLKKTFEVPDTHLASTSVNFSRYPVVQQGDPRGSQVMNVLKQ